MIFLKSNEANDTIIKYPYLKEDLKADNNRVAFSENVSDSDFIRFGATPIQETEQPSLEPYEIVTEGEPELIDGNWTQKWEISNIWDENPEIVNDYVNELRENILKQGVDCSRNRIQKDAEGNILYEQIDGPNFVMVQDEDADGNPLFEADGTTPIMVPDEDVDGNPIYEQIDGDALEETLTLKIQLADEKDFRNLSALNTTAITMKLSGQNDRIIKFRDYNNIDYMLDADDIMYVGSYVTQYMNHIFSKSWELKALISESNTQDYKNIIDTFSWE